MSKGKAMKVFHDAMLETDSSINVCDHNISVDRGEKPVPTEYGFNIRSYQRREKIGSSYERNQIVNHYVKDYVTKEVDITNSHRIDIQERKNAVGYCRTDKAGDYEVIVSYSTTGRLEFGVEQSAIDHFLAALSIVAPKAELKTGMGF